LTKRSMMSARPTTEQRISGQIGQPAACMMENKSGLRCNLLIMSQAPGPTSADGVPQWSPHGRGLAAGSYTDSVDNFVQNRTPHLPDPAISLRLDTSMTKRATHFALKSSFFTAGRGFWGPWMSQPSNGAGCGQIRPGALCV
jgi:hypothetical protein